MDNSYCSADERSPWEGNYYYWTIVIALLMSDRPGKAMITIYLLDNSYCCADERSPWEGNYYYWTIVIALLMSAIRSKCGSYILSCNKAIINY
ncbi:MAG: hypothetical protein SWX82_24165 [Cyanobacteriota bacterium]|nr:hypothetical protein [Cyanobacteriota bacterium]